MKNSMLPAGPLMIEHRLIERVVALLKKEADRLESKANPDICFITTVVDFFRTYADRCHHGKEEDILFRDLAEKELSREHKETMAALLEDHVKARELIGKLSGANTASDLKEILRKIVELYTAHIIKEDKQFFIPVMGYFNKEELEAMLCAFNDFDRTLIHEKYKKLVQQIESGSQK